MITSRLLGWIPRTSSRGMHSKIKLSYDKNAKGRPIKTGGPLHKTLVILSIRDLHSDGIYMVTGFILANVTVQNNENFENWNWEV